MSGLKLIFIIAVLQITSTLTESDIITKPEPGQEYVFVQASSNEPKQITTKNTEQSHFETAHKFPTTFTFNKKYKEKSELKSVKTSKVQKREAEAAESPAPAPAGAIKLNPQKLIEKYKSELKSSTTSTPKSKDNSKSTKRSRTKKEALEITTTSSVLTTGATIIRAVDEEPLTAGSEKQRSRIQIKKAPNGLQYEYEYIYYYYDDEDEGKKEKEPITNQHDGPAKNEIINKGDKSRYNSSEKSNVLGPSSNEILPSGRNNKARGRQLGDEDVVGEERLPANTRFPPRSRNLNTTPLPEEENKPTRGRGRVKATTDSFVSSEPDSSPEESQSTRGRTRQNIRRPSLDLVDSVSFNTHPLQPGAEPPIGGPSFPSNLPEGPVRFLGATPNEKKELPEELPAEEGLKAQTPGNNLQETITEVIFEDSTTTVMSPMDKVALDLYAILQGTQKLSGEELQESDSEESTETTDETTLETTTDVPVTEISSISTTTTTTTPAPVSSEATLFGRSKYRGRINGRKTTPVAAHSTETPFENKPKNRFGRPNFGNRPRPGTRTTATPSEQEIQKEDAKPVSHSKPTLNRARFGGSRTRTRTTANPNDFKNDDLSQSSVAPSRSPIRSRPNFHSRPRGRTTPVPSDDSATSNDGAEIPSSTIRARSRITAGSGIRPLRPGPRINLARGRPGLTSSTTEISIENPVSEVNEEILQEESGKETEVPAPVQETNPLTRLRNRPRVNVQPKAKTAASAPVQVRRINPLLARRKAGATTEPSTEAPAEAASTDLPEESEEVVDTELPAPSSSTTEEPRGLSKLLAGRRKLIGARQPGNVN